MLKSSMLYFIYNILFSFFFDWEGEISSPFPDLCYLCQYKRGIAVYAKYVDIFCGSERTTAAGAYIFSCAGCSWNLYSCTASGFCPSADKTKWKWRLPANLDVFQVVPDAEVKSFFCGLCNRPSIFFVPINMKPSGFCQFFESSIMVYAMIGCVLDVIL